MHNLATYIITRHFKHDCLTRWRSIAGNREPPCYKDSNNLPNAICRVAILCILSSSMIILSTYFFKTLVLSGIPSCIRIAQSFLEHSLE